MDFRLVLLTVALLHLVWFGRCCNKTNTCNVNGSGSCHIRSRRSLDESLVKTTTNREILRRDVKLLLLAVIVLNQIWEGTSCNKKIEVTCNCTCNKRKRRSTDEFKNVTKSEILKRNGTHFSIGLDGNPCVFETYDLDNNGIITKEELEEKLSAKKETRDLFAFIDTMDDDGVISFGEFCAAIPNLIEECDGCCYI